MVHIDNCLVVYRIKGPASIKCSKMDKFMNNLKKLKVLNDGLQMEEKEIWNYHTFVQVVFIQIRHLVGFQSSIRISQISVYNGDFRE